MKGWTCQKNFLPESLLKNLLNEALNLWNEGEFSKAGIGRSDKLDLRPEIRSDKIFWLDENSLTQNQKLYFDFINELKARINRELFLSLRTFEAHLAGYPKGSFYKKHLDQFQTQQNRLITAILYLNFDWKNEYGGKLKIHLNENDCEEILPEAGTFICFRSDLIYHEVLKCTKERFSLTGWLRRDELIF